jgi:hypothetical protein
MAKPEAKPQLIPLTAVALVKAGGGTSVLKVRLRCSLDLSVVEVDGAETSKPDYFAIAMSKAQQELEKAAVWGVRP